MDIDNILRIAVSAAYKSADVLRNKFGNIEKISKKGEIDLVTEADIESEKVIIKHIKSQFPEHSILSEESGEEIRNSDYLWIIDPLDGTTNFAHGLGLFATSIAFAAKGRVLAGVILNPITSELFSASSGKGSFLNGRPIRVSDSGIVKDSLLVTGFPYDFNTILNPLINRFQNCLTEARGIRRLGSAALDLCYVACGRFDGFWEQNLKPWDTAAGFIIAEEAGAKVTDFSGKPFLVDKKEILVTNQKIHEEMIQLLSL